MLDVSLGQTANKLDITNYVDATNMSASKAQLIVVKDKAAGAVNSKSVNANLLLLGGSVIHSKMIKAQVEDLVVVIGNGKQKQTIGSNLGYYLDYDCSQLEQHSLYLEATSDNVFKVLTGVVDNLVGLLRYLKYFEATTSVYLDGTSIGCGTTVMYEAMDKLAAG